MLKDAPRKLARYCLLSSYHFPESAQIPPPARATRMVAVDQHLAASPEGVVGPASRPRIKIARAGGTVQMVPAGATDTPGISAAAEFNVPQRGLCDKDVNPT